MADLNDARRDAYARRDAAGNRAAAIEASLKSARARGDRMAAERLQIDLDEKVAEIRRWAELANDIEEEMERQSARPVAGPTSRVRKRWWHFG